MESFLLSPAFAASFERLKANHGQLLPLKYPSVAAELNVMSILTVLNIASGYRLPLHKATGRGAYDNIRMFVMALYLSSTVETDYMSAGGMVALDHQKVADFMGVLQHIHVEAPHNSIPGVVVGELGGPIFELVQVITKILNETGLALQSGGYPDLGTFLLEALTTARGDPEVVLQQVSAIQPVVTPPEAQIRYSWCAASQRSGIWLSWTEMVGCSFWVIFCASPICDLTLYSRIHLQEGLAYGPSRQSPLLVVTPRLCCPGHIQVAHIFR